MDLAIQRRGLVKTFSTTLALGGVKLAVRRGEVHAFLSPNMAVHNDAYPAHAAAR